MSSSPYLNRAVQHRWTSEMVCGNQGVELDVSLTEAGAVDLLQVGNRRKT